MGNSPKTAKKQRPSWAAGEDAPPRPEESEPPEATQHGRMEATEPPPAEDPPAEDPPAEDPPAEDPPAEDPPAEDPPAEDPPAEDPPAEDPPAEDPPAEDPPAEDRRNTETVDGAGGDGGQPSANGSLQLLPPVVLQPPDGGAAMSTPRPTSSTQQSPKRDAGGRGGFLASLVRRISGYRRTTPEDPAPTFDSGPGASPGSPPRQSSPEQIEARLKLALSETTRHSLSRSRICVGSPKGGVGKSSVAYAVAGSIASHTNLKVVLVDADPNFGSTRLLVPRPVDSSVMDLAADADELECLWDLSPYVAENSLLRLDVLLNPVDAADIAAVDDLAAAYERVDEVLSRHYHVIVYDLGLGFRDPAIQRVLSLSDELLFVSDGEVIPNAMLSSALRYVENLGVDLGRTTLALNHRLPPGAESEAAPRIRAEHAGALRRITEIPYDPALSQLLNRRSFHTEQLELDTRLGILTTAAVALEGLRKDAPSGGVQKKVAPRSRSTRAAKRPASEKKGA